MAQKQTGRWETVARTKRRTPQAAEFVAEAKRPAKQAIRSMRKVKKEAGF